MAVALYHNQRNIKYPFIYARPYSFSQPKKEKVLIRDAYTSINVQIIGVPDGVSPLATYTPIFNAPSSHRMVVYASSSLSKKELQHIDAEYKEDEKPHPYSLVTKINCKTNYTIPSSINYYKMFINATFAPDIYEYRLVTNRFEPARIMWDTITGKQYPVSLPSSSVTKVFVMPINFMRTGIKQGYFSLPNNLILWVFSKVPLAGKHYEVIIAPKITVLPTMNDRLKYNIELYFSQLQLHNIIYNNNQVVAYDNELIGVVGSLENIYPF